MEWDYTFVVQRYGQFEMGENGPGNQGSEKRVMRSSEAGEFDAKARWIGLSKTNVHVQIRAIGMLVQWLR